MTHFAAGDVEKALEYFDTAVEEKSAWVLWLATEPKLDALRKNERFRSILRKAGLKEIN